MKRIFVLMALFVGFMGYSQVVNFPDVIFKNTLLSASTSNFIALDATGFPIKIDTNNDNQIQVAEAQLVFYLDVHSKGINDLTGIASFVNLRNLKCYYNNLTALNINANTLLTHVECYANNITSLTVTGLPNLLELDCGSNLLQTLSLNNLPTLNYLRCNQNLLSNINLSNTPNIATLHCFNNNFTSLNIAGLDNIQYIACNYNQITSLNLDMYPTLGAIDCSNNLITSIVCHSQALMTLTCPYNLLTSLDLSTIPNLANLKCHNNNIASLNFSGLQHLHDIDCSFNQLTSLIFQNNNNAQVDLACSYNQLTTLDLTQIGTSYIVCDNNQLQSLLIKNGTLTLFSAAFTIQGNPNLTYVCVDEGERSFVESKILQAGITNCEVNSYCSFLPGGLYYSISGQTRYDDDANGCDASDMLYPSIKFNLTNTSYSQNFVMDSSGNYSLSLPEGVNTITPIFENPSYFTISPPNIMTNFPTQTSPLLQNFCISPNGNHNDLEVVIIPINAAIPGFDANYKILFRNKGTTQLSGVITFSYDDAKMDLVSAIPVFSSQATGLLTFNYANLLPLEKREISVKMNLNSPTETPPLNGGDQLNFNATITPTTTDEFLYDNYHSIKQKVVNSLDPNDKICTEGNLVGTSVIGQYVHYVIRFENTGTFAAQNIVVKDLIDLTKFDLNSLVPMSSSHPFVTRMDTTGKVEFIFEGINLPFNDANNDGYIAFKIKTKPTLVVGDTFANSASIYFDYNFPVDTDPAITTIQALATHDFAFDTYFTLSPNPTKDMLYFRTKAGLVLHSIQIYNTLGQLVLVGTNPGDSLDVSGLKPGSYLVTINTDNGTTSTKFIKQ